MKKLCFRFAAAHCLAWILVLSALPLIFVTIIVASLYKFLVVMLSIVIRNQENLVKPISGLDIFFTTDDFYGRPYGAIGFAWIVNGPVSPQIITDRLEHALFSSIEKEGFEKLVSFLPAFWLGYPFWKKAKPFDIRNQVKIMQPEASANFLEQKYFSRLIREWMDEPFERNVPLWEIRILPGNAMSIIVLKTHHVLGDGYSMTALLNKIIDPPQQSAEFLTMPRKASNIKGTVRRKTSGFWKNTVNLLHLIFLTPLTVVSLLNQFVIHGNCWFTRKKESDRMNWATTWIPMETISEIRKCLSSGSHFRMEKVPMNVIAVSALAGALKRLLQNQNNMPSSANFVISLPISGDHHPGSCKYCNFWTHGILNVNMKDSDSLQRLSEVSSEYSRMQIQRTPEIYHKLMKVFSLFPKPILKFITSYNMGASIGVTNLAGPSSPVFIEGQRVICKYGYCGLLWRHASLTLVLYSYDGKLALSLLGNESVVKDWDSVNKLLCQFFLEELESLK